MMFDYQKMMNALWYCGGGEANNYDCAGCPGKDLCHGFDNKKNICTESAAAFKELLAAVPNWVRVEDRLPDREGYYLVAVTNEHGRRYTKSAFFMGPQHGTWFARQKVTHWTIPLAPPEEATGDA